MRAGNYNHKVSIQGSSGSRNEYGEDIQTDNPPVSFWAEIRPKSGTQSFIAAQHSDETTHEIKTWYRPDIKAGMEILFRSRTFKIEVALNPDEANRELILICVERS